MHRMKIAAPVLLTLSLGLAACGSSGTEDADRSTTTTEAPSTTGSGTPIGTVPAGTTVSANAASVEELTAALTAAGVENPDAWADEVIEHRPYAADDPTMQGVRDALAEYDPPPDLLDKLVSALTP